MPKMSKRGEVRIFNSRYVLSSAEQHAETIAGAMSEKMAGLNATSLKEVLKGLSTYLAEETDQLESSEIAYLNEQDDDADILNARNETLGDLQDFLKGIRGFMRTQDVTMLKRYGLEKMPPRGIEGLLNYSKTAARMFVNNNVPFVGKFGITFDPNAAGTQLKEKLEACEVAVEAVHHEARELENLLSERDERLEEWRVAYLSVSNVLVAFYQIAGKPGLAKRIRPTRRRTRGELAIDDKTEAAVEEASEEISEEVES